LLFEEIKIQTGGQKRKHRDHKLFNNNNPHNNMSIGPCNNFSITQTLLNSEFNDQTPFTNTRARPERRI